MLPKNIKSFVINTLRRASMRWVPRSKCLAAARVPIGHFKNGKVKYGYQCKHCLEGFMRKDTEIDHIIPVVDPLKGDFTIDEYCARLFVGISGFQVLCIPCHLIKTDAENSVRGVTKKKVKNVKKTRKKSKKSRLGKKAKRKKIK